MRFHMKTLEKFTFLCYILRVLNGRGPVSLTIEDKEDIYHGEDEAADHGAEG